MTTYFQTLDQVFERKSFMSPMKLALLPHLMERYDFTFFIEEATLTFAMAKPQLKPQWQSLYYPLTDEVWASILGLLALIPAAFFLVLLAVSSSW